MPQISATHDLTTYREHHKWEKEDDVQATCQRLVEIIIRDEQPEFDNYKDIDIPASALQAIKAAEGQDEDAAAASATQLPAIEPAPK